MQFIVGYARDEATAVPGEHWLARCVVQHPAVTGIHAVLKEQVASDVVTGRKALRVQVAGVVEWVYTVEVTVGGIMYCITRLPRGSVSTVVCPRRRAC